MNTRLQVEHPVTEEVAGLDLVHLMLRIASGEPLGLTQDDVALRGHAIEARITAQDPDADFAPSTGTITGWRSPGGRGVRMETYCYAGIGVSPFYDPMIAKLVVRGETREQAVAWMVDNVGESPVPARREIVRYCVYPGQACSFKVGQNQIVALREAARAKLGARFEMRGFHDVVLLGGPMPMQTLIGAVRRWAV